ncbi:MULTISPECIES: glycosyltransferase family 2 protein [unclassified Herbaspirillum]|jgi:glycosyltransferase involved in cell wall biosynthesis|uniref:glycosyltransferase family 2 protein n=1 Tax=Herbaspirillum TaxID=963 RepID=UPI000C0A4CB2|nr:MULTISPECIES: glycosyltransferase family 2 protein [unclassified Herbaspirillum]MAF03530.1 glycosyl transferase [Herbaspirillum sp.]MBO15775.1 glycosyl transferase [Herbaspirillum sp.]MCP3658239.1 glycosyltransferase [Herbaspirillum sp.]MCP3950325.1 glycosyltransferase [Herbaspirillum sp.]MCP4033591.1 glycosyltransferase [Herbaspirillum sp.]|tara:strand:+ start:7070 stop:8026 length:957 start_codon:yes stop_codon:yes gene_type:complete
MSDPRYTHVAVIIPCYDEEATIEAVIKDFSRALPGARIYVFDNNSRDRTIEVARASGAIVREVPYQGKGSVIRRMFADVEADIYVMVDGDDTYDAAQAPELVKLLADNCLDMVVGMRQTQEHAAYRAGHRFGNVLLTQCVGVIFGQTFKDMLSGYRVFSRRYVKSFPAHSMGFEIETELTVHALELRMPVLEVPTNYKARPEGSVSKLNTYRDGIRILYMILSLFKTEKPLPAFSIAFFVCIALSIGLATPIFETYFTTGLVPRLPTALLCAALVLFGAIMLVCGIVLDTVTHGRTEAKRFAYLSIPGPREEGTDARC